jgi:L,D-peptidoglycan transpeptidase YkuD (ErfK/YbiS/YcfS/YnhG family)
MLSAMVSRRNVLLSSLAATAMPSAFADLRYTAGRLSWPGGGAPAACGRAGVCADKREGDGATPLGTFPVLRAF